MSVSKAARLPVAVLLASVATAISFPSAAHGASAVPITQISDGMSAGQIVLPVNKSQVVKIVRPFRKALIGSSEIADVLPLTNRSLYVLGKKVGTTTLTIYDGNNSLVQVFDVAVGPDVIGLRHSFADLMPGEKIGAKISNDSIVLTGSVSSGPAADRAVQLASTYSGDKVVNMLTVGAAQQVMLEVRFSEMSRTAAKQIGVNNAFISNSGKFQGGTGDSAPSTALLTNQNGVPTIDIKGILNTFGIVAGGFNLGGTNLFSALDALERKGVITTLAEPTLIALSGETASFLAGGEFPIPVAQGNSGIGGGAGASGSSNITVEFKPFGVSLAFTPTVLADGVISLVVAPEVSSIDPSASININGLVIPGLQTRRAKTTLELRDGQSFAIAGLLRKDFQDTIRQVPLLGSLPIIGTLFRSTGFQHEETELVIIVTPRLIRPVRAGAFKSPTDRVGPPNAADLLLNGRTDTGVPPSSAPFVSPPPPPPPVMVAPPTGSGGTAQTKPTGFEKDYGHVL